MAKLLATPEFLIPDGAKITDIFGEAFFTSNYWYMWRSLFAFQPWHSAVEMKRYMRLCDLVMECSTLHHLEQLVRVLVKLP